jgi:hypothetical protein
MPDFDGELYYRFIYIQQGRQWGCFMWATDELDAWRKAKRGLKAGNYYLGHEYI